MTGGDFDRVREWANVHLRDLLRTYAPDAAAKLRGDRCPCPMHGGDGPNLSLYKNPTGPGELWRCHSGCGTSGGGVELVQALTGRPGKAGRLDVLRELAPRAGVSLGLSQLGTRRPVRAGGTGKVRPKSDEAISRESLGINLPPDPFAALRADGVIPSLPPAVHTAVSRHLTLGDRGAAYLAGRGLDPTAARAYGFRSLETRADWGALEAFLAANYLPDERTAAGVASIPGAGTAALVLPYRTADGMGWDGFRLRSLEPGGFWRSANGEPLRYLSLKGLALPLPFNADALRGADEVHLVEGEMNAYTLHTYGLAALGLDGATKWRSDWTPFLRGAARVVAWYDGDNAGADGRAKLAATLAAAFGYEWLTHRGRFLAIPKRDGGKDANDLHQRGALAPILERAEWRTN
jgi:hypothetical protein